MQALKDAEDVEPEKFSLIYFRKSQVKLVFFF